MTFVSATQLPVVLAAGDLSADGIVSVDGVDDGFGRRPVGRAVRQGGTSAGALSGRQ
jgi:hypothetical protein